MVLGAFGLPFGLMMTLLTGAELFTGNTALVGMAALEGEATPGQLIKSWTSSYAGNFLGSVVLAYLAFAGGVLGPAGGASVAVAAAKTSLSFKAAFVKGILCNWLVCMGERGPQCIPKRLCPRHSYTVHSARSGVPRFVRQGLAGQDGGYLVLHLCVRGHGP